MTKLFEEIELSKLASLPHVLIKLLNACHEDSVCFDTLTDIITKDAALSAKVISVSNSPVYGKACKLTSLKQVLLYLGLDVIKSIAITASVQQFFSSYSKEKSRFLKGFWLHTLSTGIVAKSLAKLTSYNNPEEAYIAGLLHDIGQLIFESYSKHEYSRLVESTASSDELLAAEQEKYEITHADIGVRLLEIWGVPQVISQAVKYHHASSSDVSEAHQLIKIINLANSMTSKSAANQDLDLNCAQGLFDLSDSVLQDILNKAQTEVKKIATSLEIDIEPSDAADNKDEAMQIQLAKEIRDITLAQSSMLPITDELSGLDYSGIQKSNKILFGINKSCLFIFDEESGSLLLNASTAQINKEFLEGLELSTGSQSIIADAYRSSMIKDSFSAEVVLPVVDNQIINALACDAILCLPLNMNGKCAGVIVMGISQNQYASLQEKLPLLKIYAAELSGRVFYATSRQKLKENFIRASQQKIHTKAREIIHEVNNPLTVIKNYLHILAKRFNEDSSVQNDIAIIGEEIDRVGSIILKCDKDLDEIDTAGQLQKTDVNELINSMNNIMTSSLYTTREVTSRLELDKNIEPVMVNKNSLKQILTNLIKNSVEAMTDKKEIKITTRSVNINGKAYIEIEIADTGPGMPETVLKNIYKPVSSTKGKLHSGLGLSIVKNLLDEMGGLITCKTGKSGTAFSVHLALE